MRRRALLRSGATVMVGSGIAAAVGASPEGAGYAPIGEVAVDGATELVTRGTTGYVAASNGFVTVDLSDPADPSVMAERRGLFAEKGGPLRQVYDVKVDGDRLVVAGPAGGAGELRGFGVYDVTDPADPRLRGFQRTSTPIHNCDVDGDHVYVTGNDLDANPLVIYDVSGDDIRKVGSWSPLDHRSRWGTVNPYLRYLHDVYVQDGVAYCAYWDAGSWLLDVTDPADPSLIARFGDHTADELAGLGGDGFRSEYTDPPGNAHYPHVSDDGRLYGIGRESWDYETGDDTGGPSGIDLYDVSDAASPERLSTIEPTQVEDATRTSGTTTTAHNFEFAGDRLYSSWYKDGVKLFDVADPSNPEPLAHWRQPTTHDIWTAQSVVPGEYFAASNYGDFRKQASILTFPDRSGTQTDMPALEPSATPTSTSTTTASTLTATDGTPADPDAATGPDTADGTDTTTGVPGFGALSATAGLSLAAWRLRRRRD